MATVQALLGFVIGTFRSRIGLQLEIVALRQQLAVYKRSIRRPRIRPSDRILWAWLARQWSRWREILVFVQPATVVAWQRKRFRDHWARLSRKTPGRPGVSEEITEGSGRTREGESAEDAVASLLQEVWRKDETRLRGDSEAFAAFRSLLRWLVARQNSLALDLAGAIGGL